VRREQPLEGGAVDGIAEVADVDLHSHRELLKSMAEDRLWDFPGRCRGRADESAQNGQEGDREKSGRVDAAQGESSVDEPTVSLHSKPRTPHPPQTITRVAGAVRAGLERLRIGRKTTSIL
jgi:hypothetical protein